MAEALAVVEYPVTHVVEEFPENPGRRPGQNRTPDEEIAQWCAQTGHVLVTTDHDFKGKWVRSGLLASHGVEVIVFDKDIPGLRAQHERITRHFPWWESELGKVPYGHRVWKQSLQLHPKPMVGQPGSRQRPKRRKRVAVPGPRRPTR